MADQQKTYICPMHSEVVSDKPGQCYKCGMALQDASSSSPVEREVEDKGQGNTWRNYIPLIVIISMITGVSIVVANKNGFNLNQLLLAFMTGFFLVFAGFKLMDLPGFAQGYATYDLLAQRLFGYGYVYPFIELTFGLLMVAGYHPKGLLWMEFVVMVFSGIGVTIKLLRREKFTCACLGTFLKVPLTYITLIEDFGMAILALILIVVT